MTNTEQENLPQETLSRAEARRIKKQKRAEEKKKRKMERHEKQRRLLFPANKKGLHYMPLMNFLRILLYPIHYLLFPFKLHGHTKVGPGAFLYVCNHYCLWDVFYPAHTTWEGVHFMAKESVLHAPVVGYFARRLGVIGAMRDGSDVRTIMDCRKVLKNGEKLSMFPEGTRNKVSDDKFLPFHGGAAMIAIKTRTPIIPMVICSRPKAFRMTHVVIGEPVELTEYYGKKLTAEEYAEAEEKLVAMMYSLRSDFYETQAKRKKNKV